jgi:hypothetical protein
MPCDAKDTCGQTISSSCSFYVGPDLTFVTPEDQVKCDSTVTDVIIKIDKYLKILVDGNNLTDLDKDCLDFDPATVTPAELHQIEITAICVNKGNIESLQEQFETLNIGIETIEIDLPACLKPLAAPCEVGTNTYQLITLLTLFANMLCDHEARITALES